MEDRPGPKHFMYGVAMAVVAGLILVGFGRAFDGSGSSSSTLAPTTITPIAPPTTITTSTTSTTATISATSTTSAPITTSTNRPSEVVLADLDPIDGRGDFPAASLGGIVVERPLRIQVNCGLIFSTDYLLSYKFDRLVGRVGLVDHYKETNYKWRFQIVDVANDKVLESYELEYGTVYDFDVPVKDVLRVGFQTDYPWNNLGCFGFDYPVVVDAILKP